jgi:hypothetical protein
VAATAQRVVVTLGMEERGPAQGTGGRGAPESCTDRFMIDGADTAGSLSGCQGLADRSEASWESPGCRTGQQVIVEASPDRV